MEFELNINKTASQGKYRINLSLQNIKELPGTYKNNFGEQFTIDILVHESDDID